MTVDKSIVMVVADEKETSPVFVRVNFGIEELCAGVSVAVRVKRETDELAPVVGGNGIIPVAEPGIVPGVSVGAPLASPDDVVDPLGVVDDPACPLEIGVEDTEALFVVLAVFVDADVISLELDKSGSGTSVAALEVVLRLELAEDAAALVVTSAGVVVDDWGPAIFETLGLAVPGVSVLDDSPTEEDPELSGGEVGSTVSPEVEVLKVDEDGTSIPRDDDDSPTEDDVDVDGLGNAPGDDSVLEAVGSVVGGTTGGVELDDPGILEGCVDAVELAL